MNYVARVDISGTFTDCVVMDEAGRINPHDRAIWMATATGA
jgi:N-methylhydantoinase A/oxoprolinase/acetone carboxylase beta subunit